MGIFNLITNNLVQKAHTRRPAAQVPVPEGFRGELIHDAGRCVACGTCAYVCSPSAIDYDRSQSGSVTWEYQLLKCTFCGRCVDYCPTHALSFKRSPAEPLHTPSLTQHTIAYQHCPRCGEPVIPLPQVVLEERYGGTVPEGIAELNKLCERCRKRVHSTAIKHGFTGDTKVSGVK